jgi:hypothetical protein
MSALFSLLSVSSSAMLPDACFFRKRNQAAGFSGVIPQSENVVRPENSACRVVCGKFPACHLPLSKFTQA